MLLLLAQAIALELFVNALATLSPVHIHQAIVMHVLQTLAGSAAASLVRVFYARALRTLFTRGSSGVNAVSLLQKTSSVGGEMQRRTVPNLAKSVIIAIHDIIHASLADIAAVQRVSRVAEAPPGGAHAATAVSEGASAAPLFGGGVASPLPASASTPASPLARHSGVLASHTPRAEQGRQPPPPNWAGGRALLPVLPPLPRPPLPQEDVETAEEEAQEELLSQQRHAAVLVAAGVSAEEAAAAAAPGLRSLAGARSRLALTQGSLEREEGTAVAARSASLLKRAPERPLPGPAEDVQLRLPTPALRANSMSSSGNDRSRRESSSGPSGGGDRSDADADRCRLDVTAGSAVAARRSVQLPGSPQQHLLPRPPAFDLEVRG